MGLAALAFGWVTTQWQIATAWTAHLEQIDNDMQVKAERIQSSLQAVSNSLQLIALTSGVRRVSNNDQSLNILDRQNIQQIVAQITSQFENAQVYVVPEGFRPETLNPATGVLQAPGICFNCSSSEANIKVPSGVHPSVNQSMTLSQRQIMVEQLQWFRTFEASQKAAAPVINSPVMSIWAPAVNSEIVAQHVSAIAFSTPYSNVNGEFAGLVTAAIPVVSLSKIVPAGSFALESPKSEFKSGKLAAITVKKDWRPWLIGNQSTPATFGSEQHIAVNDPRGFWKLTSRHDSQAFYDTSSFLGIRRYATWTGLAYLLLTLLGVAAIGVSRREGNMLRHNASHDALTGLPNRMLLESHINLLLADLSRKPITSVVLYLDLDRFKAVNDTLGHQVGDKVLQHAANTITKSIRANDVAARIGGDEFVVLMRNSSAPYDAVTVASRIIENIATPFVIDGHTISIGTSIGIAILQQDMRKPDEVLRCADLAMFRVKNEEKGSFRFFEPSMDAEHLRRRKLEADLRQALQNNEFILHYQPIISAANGEVSSCEALLRWHHPERGMVQPMQFIPMVEELGLISAIGEWALNRACKDAQTWPAHIKVAVNISVRQMRSQVFPLQVISALNQSGLTPNRLELELTESILASGDKIVLDNVNQLRTAGVRIALDDFGIGFSSLNCLKEYDFDRIKIDRSFLPNMSTEKMDAVFQAITTIGTQLGMSVTAEGIETLEQLNSVKAQGCTEMQGYYFSKPKTLEDLRQFFDQEKSKARA